MLLFGDPVQCSPVTILGNFQRVSNAALAKAALVLSSKNWKKYSRWGAASKKIQNALGFLPPCGNRCRFSESAICSSRVHPPSKIKLNFKFKTLRWRLLRWRLTLSEISGEILGDLGGGGGGAKNPKKKSQFCLKKG